MWRRDRNCAPPWWPANERWPPVRGSRAWRGRRRRLPGGMVVFVLLLFLLFAFGLSSLTGFVFRQLGMAQSGAYLAPLLAWMFFFFLFVFGIRRVGSPVSDIVAAAQRVAGGDFSTRIDAHGPRFVRAVAGAFNTMTERLEAHDRQRRELMADIAHELRTPLTVIQGRLEGLLDGVYPRDDQRLEAVLEETRMLARLVEDLRTLANAETGILSLQKEPTEVAPLIQDAVDSLSAEATAAGVSVRVEATADLPPLDIDPLRIREVLVNLLSNALCYSPPGGRVTISAARSASGVTVSVADTGAGISPEELPRIFDRFYKGRTSRGSGLGLTIARNLIAAHGGAIRADSASGRGTTMTFELPRADSY